MENCEITVGGRNYFGNIIEESGTVFIVAMASQEGFDAAMGARGIMQLRKLRKSEVFNVRIDAFDAPIENLRIPFRVLKR